jgi:hypothetical protein
MVVLVTQALGLPTPAHATHKHSGYWMLTADGHVYGFGGAAHMGETVLVDRVDIEGTPSGHGYWILSKSGSVYDYGDADYHGLGQSLPRGEEYVSMSATPAGDGFWLFTNRGRAIAKGAARHFGDMSGITLNGPILDSVATPSGEGYWMVASDGGVFSFGDAKFYGSMGDKKLNKPVMSLAPDPDGVGYWLVASDGGIFAFDAPFYGSMGAVRLNKPISGMVGGAGGYLMVAEDGGIFTFGDVDFHGSLGAEPPASPVVAVAVVDEPINDGSFGDGTFVVGAELPAGTYRTAASTESCYWARLSGFGGELDDIKANDIGDGPRVVTIDASDRGFKSSRCMKWTKNLGPVTTSRTSFGVGVFITGTDFEPGTYRTETFTDDCYWARLSGFGGELDDIIANDMGDGVRIVEIKSTDAGFKSSRCGTWTKVG